MNGQLFVHPSPNVSEYANGVRLANVRLLMARLMHSMNQYGSWAEVGKVELDPHYSPKRLFKERRPLQVKMLELPVVGNSPWRMALGQDGYIYNLRPFVDVQIGTRMLQPPHRITEQWMSIDDLERSLEQMLEQHFGT